MLQSTASIPITAFSVPLLLLLPLLTAIASAAGSWGAAKKVLEAKADKTELAEVKARLSALERSRDEDRRYAERMESRLYKAIAELRDDVRAVLARNQE